MNRSHREPREIISTARLVLRSTIPDDIPALHARVMSDPDVVRYVFSGTVVSPADSERFVRDRFELVRPSHRILGVDSLQCTWRRRSRARLRAWQGVLGRGYATEIGLAQIEFGFTRLYRQRLLALVDQANTASIHALEKLRMTLECTLAFEGRGERRVYSVDRRRTE
jgi:ribosomal-protein-alanine N-acetyltransferase